MIKVCIAIFLTNLTLFLQAQDVQSISEKPIDEALLDIERLVGKQIKDGTKVFGIGEVATFARETQRFNTALAAYLIGKQGFSAVLLEEDDWKVRELNGYLASKDILDTLVIDSLVRFGLSVPNLRTGEFKEFIIWIKKYNLSNPDAIVGVYGVSANSSIPVDYLVNNYVTTIDYEATPKLAERWFKNHYSESEAYQHVEDWINSIDASTMTSEVAQLIGKYRKDINHNKMVLKPNSQDLKFSVSDFDRFETYVVDQVLEKSKDKAILYSSNSRIMKGNFQSKSVIDNPVLPTLGKNLHIKLKGNYSAFLTDFSGSAQLPIADIEAQKISVEDISGSERARNLALKGDRFFLPKDIKDIKEFIPASISFFKGRDVTLVLDEQLNPVDAIFLFSNLTDAEVLSNLD
ncbi:erythromycin esterase family protein [Sphingobacterium hungaricum]|uniref:Uncharacterized protein n=1 Tax=Sphingobacterium hungaricum TaxID=2082723 RepID=A0A928USZ5_9SPHI|nr:erythromycin esterase family protein [Sphingobacterium hungaricum]MBE8712645.1 hypothetical protein [Sphingobacterium hungaricum]